MERDIKDYLHLYIGSDINMEVTWKSVTTGALDSRIKSVTVFTLYMYGHEPGYDIIMKPILRPLSDMTDGEGVMLVHLQSEIFLDVKTYRKTPIRFEFSFEYASSSRRRFDSVSYRELNPEQFQYLLSKGFDLFNLIPDGLAIDATTISKTV